MFTIPKNRPNIKKGDTVIKDFIPDDANIVMPNIGQIINR